MTLSATAPSVRAQLRAVTDDIHQALHHAAPFAAIADGALDLQGYGAVLTFLYCYHQGLADFCGQGAVALGVPQLAVAHRTRIASLEYDLAHLVRTPPPAMPSRSA